MIDNAFVRVTEAIYTKLKNGDNFIDVDKFYGDGYTVTYGLTTKSAQHALKHDHNSNTFFATKSLL